MKKISYKLWLGMSILVLGVMAGIWIFQIYFYPNLYLEKKETETREKAYLLASYFNNQELDAALELISSFESQDNIRVVVLDANNNTRYATASLSYYLLNDCTVWAPFVQLMGEGNIFSDEFKPPYYDTRYFRAGLSIGGFDGFGGVIYLFMPFADIDTTTEIIKDQFILLTGILLAGSLIVAGVMSLFLTRPISKIEKRAGEMARGDLETPFLPSTKDEIGRLTLTMERLREALLQFERLSKELIANVSHELRTPLAIIRGYAETVRDVTWQNDMKRETQLNAIIEESQRLERVVNDILDYSQLQSGKIHFKKDRVNLSELVLRISSRMHEYTARGNINIQKDIQNNVFVLGDETKLEQVVTNLVANAYNHSPENSMITVTLMTKQEAGSKNGKRVVLEISDCGEGISPEELPHIWERYYKATLRGREDRIGTGLGLAICKIILNAHNAQFSVESMLGEGSTFTLYFELFPD